MTQPDARAEHIVAPWTPEQVEALNRWQHGPMHPFTCGGGGHTAPVVLVAFEDGWHCPVSWCGYTQNWAHDFMARAERTEPATGEDFNDLRRIVAQRIDSYIDPNEPNHALMHDVDTIAGDVVDAILAALDLPGREQALRKERDAALRQLEVDNGIPRAVHAAALRGIADLEQQRDDARQRLANVTASLDDLKNANDQLHVARDNTAQLLKEAREENTEFERYVRVQHLYSGLHDTLGVNLTCKGCALLAASDAARQHATAEAAPDGDGAA